nr:hypothetical protein [Candidatus Jidaibacter acanthamoeba]
MLLLLSAYNLLIISNSGSLNFFGLPPNLPLDRAAPNPAKVLSFIISFSNSAIAANM